MGYTKINLVNRSGKIVASGYSVYECLHNRAKNLYTGTDKELKQSAMDHIEASMSKGIYTLERECFIGYISKTIAVKIFKGNYHYTIKKSEKAKLRNLWNEFINDLYSQLLISEKQYENWNYPTFMK